MKETDIERADRLFARDFSKYLERMAMATSVRSKSDVDAHLVGSLSHMCAALLAAQDTADEEAALLNDFMVAIKQETARIRRKAS